MSMPSYTGCLAWSRRTVPDGISRRAVMRARTCRPFSARPSPSSSTVRQRYAGQGASRRRYRHGARPSSRAWTGRAGHGQVEQGVDREPALFVTCRRPAPQGREVIRHTGAVVSRSVTGPASLTYRIGLTCIGELVVKVATPGRAELDDLYATTRTPGRPTSESAEMRALRARILMRCPVYCPGRRSDQAPPINDRASAGPTTRS
jgi:hypothetical protein